MGCRGSEGVRNIAEGACSGACWGRRTVAGEQGSDGRLLWSRLRGEDKATALQGRTYVITVCLVAFCFLTPVTIQTQAHLHYRRQRVQDNHRLQEGNAPATPQGGVIGIIHCHGTLRRILSAREHCGYAFTTNHVITPTRMQKYAVSVFQFSKWGIE